MVREQVLRDIFFLVWLTVFGLYSKVVFDEVYKATGLIVDELFHVPQGMQYCEGNLTMWNPKITTLPGLYLFSAAILGPLGLCSVYWLRFVNLLLTIFNIYLLYMLFDLREELESTSDVDDTKESDDDSSLSDDFDKPKRRIVSWRTIISSLNVGMLPPLYFFGHIYYTDVLSLTTVLLTLLMAKKENHVLGSIFGYLSVLVRQTNVVWVAMILGEQIIQILVQIARGDKEKKHNTSLQDFIGCLRNLYVMKFYVIRVRFTEKHFLAISAYLFVLITFVAFVILNNGIVVGDRTAHEATLHLPQLFYFSLFCAFFALPHFCLEIKPFVKFALQKKMFIVCAGIICFIVIYLNTHVHPYMLADNRHYTFYIWNRIYGRYTAARYLAIVIYIFSIFALLEAMNFRKNFGFTLCFTPALVLVLTLQKLIDLRYFLIPFVLVRLRFSKLNALYLLLETLFYILINIQTFYIFFTKEIYWEDFDYVQRLIW